MSNQDRPTQRPASAPPQGDQPPGDAEMFESVLLVAGTPGQAFTSPPPMAFPGQSGVYQFPAPGFGMPQGMPYSGFAPYQGAPSATALGYSPGHAGPIMTPYGMMLPPMAQQLYMAPPGGPPMVDIASPQQDTGSRGLNLEGEGHGDGDGEYRRNRQSRHHSRSRNARRWDRERADESDREASRERNSRNLRHKYDELCAEV